MRSITYARVSGKERNIGTLFLRASILLIVTTLSRCAVANPNINTFNYDGSISGFWAGLWHGFVLPVALITSFFNTSINIYEVYNTGFGYNAGFLIGILIWAGGASAR